MDDHLKDTLEQSGKIYSAAAIKRVGTKLTRRETTEIIGVFAFAAHDMGYSPNLTAISQKPPHFGKALIAIASDGNTSVATNNLLAAYSRYAGEIYAVADAVQPNGDARPGFEYKGPEPVTPAVA